MTIAERVTVALKKVRFFRAVKRISAKRRSLFREKIRDMQNKIDARKEWLRNNPEGSPSRIRYHRVRVRRERKNRDRYKKKLRFWRKRFVWARNRDEEWTQLYKSRRRRLRRERRIDASDFENSMTGSHEYWTLTKSAKAVVAIGVLKYGLWVSSTYRPETPGSHHAEDPTRGADLAGEWDDMVAFQRWLYRNHKSAMLELIGPNNDLNVKNGTHWSLDEGSYLEDLHDTHVHGFVSSPGYNLTYG